MNYLLIDAYNLAHRVHWTHRMLSFEGIPVSCLYGFFSSLSSLKRKFPSHLFIVAWDGGYERRAAESLNAVKSGIIPTGYKANRPKPEDELPPDVEIVHEQIEPLKEALRLARVFQVSVNGVEADDIISTYAKQNELSDGNSIIVTSDKDFLQCLTDKIHIYDSMKSNYWTRKIFIDSYGFEPNLWVDVGSLMGDISDNIISVPGIGEKTAISLIKEYGNIDNVINSLKLMEKRKKKEQAILDYEKRVRLAYSLKKMDIINNLPQPRCANRSSQSLLEWFKQFKFESLYESSIRLTR